MGADQHSCVGRGHKDTPKRPKHGAALMQPARASQYALWVQAAKSGTKSGLCFPMGEPRTTKGG